MQQIKLTVTSDGRYYCDPVISQSEWEDIIRVVEKTHKRQLDALLMFYRKPGHKGTCGEISKEYTMSDTAVNSLIVHFNKFAKQYTGNRFQIIQAADDKECFWPISMIGKRLRDNSFEWTVRPELCAALRKHLIQSMLQEYRIRILSEGLNNSETNEKYKWEVSTKCQGKTTSEILDVLLSSSCNLIEKPHAGATMSKLIKDNRKEELCKVFDILRKEASLSDRLVEFSQSAKAITPEGATSFGDERTAATFLFCIDPQIYTPYTFTMYREYCSYLGEETKTSIGEKYRHFLTLLEEIRAIEITDVELIDKLHEDTEGLVWSDLLNAQDVLWQMQSFFKATRSRNWLQKTYDEAIANGHWVYKGWFPKYKESIAKFTKMFDEGQTADTISEDTKDYLIRVPENYISSNGQGTFSKSEYQRILNDWPAIYEILKDCYTKGDIEEQDRRELESLINKHSDKKHPAALHRIWAGILPNILTTIITNNRFFDTYNRIREIDTSLPASSGSWTKDNKTLMSFFDEKVIFKDPLHKALLAWYLHEELTNTETDSKMDKYIKLLEANHNLILTGAPGTGKTFLAKSIAEAMGATEENGNVKMVQFHPSYDYTDFVEGLRPKKDGEGFERVDGVFKSFCAKALSTTRTNNFEESYGRLIADLMEMEEPLKLQTPSGKTYAVSANSNNGLNLHTGTELKHNGSLTKANIEAQLGGENVFKWWEGYFKGVENLLISQYGLVIDQKKPQEKYVFIIDEINRGELSKIFGELFFSIDPGYRGTKGRVETQYQNLVEIGDPFEKGFYVPENVYIIGTMNDIDRGVESMDFAIRRRFAWEEVTPMSRVEMLEEKIPELAEQAIKSMNALNATLEEKAGLSSAYHIGPAYYLKLENYEGSTEEKFDSLWQYHIRGVIFEYLRGTRNAEKMVEDLKAGFDKYKEE